jgi:hypothetical protein
MFLFLHRYAEEYPLQCGLTAAAIVRQLQAKKAMLIPVPLLNTDQIMLMALRRLLALFASDVVMPSTLSGQY